METAAPDSSIASCAARLSGRVADLRPSPIRDILAVIDRPGMISFAGGLPAPESFPALSLEGMPREVMQYGASEGEPELRERIAVELRSLGFRVSSGQVLVLSGSQQGIDLVSKLFIDAGTRVAVESPTYLAALQSFRFFGARFEAFDGADAAIGARLRGLAGSGAAFAYCIPTFQNPSGRCMSLAERRALAAACDAARLPLFEDDPYRDLVYDPCERTPVCARLEHAEWIYQGSFSKSLAPGLRLGFLAASPALVPLLTRLKQAADLHSNRISQWLVLRALNAPDRSRCLQELAENYRRRRDAFAQSLERHFKGLASWEMPPGGLFFWLKLNRRIDTRELLPRAIDQNVAFMPGEPFFPIEEGGRGYLRLNFSHAAENQADLGLARLAALVREAVSA